MFSTRFVKNSNARSSVQDETKTILPHIVWGEAEAICMTSIARYCFLMQVPTPAQRQNFASRGVAAFEQQCSNGVSPGKLKKIREALFGWDLTLLNIASGVVSCGGGTRPKLDRRGPQENGRAFGRVGGSIRTRRLSPFSAESDHRGNARITAAAMSAPVLSSGSDG
jgi:hypothetical protein